MSDSRVVYRDQRGREYVSVPLPTHEVTDPVPLNARHAGKRPTKAPVPFYEGTDGAELAAQPRSHRRRWSDAQWVAFEEQRKAEVEESQKDFPVAAALVIKPRDP
jgi:hypothetical protein